MLRMLAASLALLEANFVKSTVLFDLIVPPEAVSVAREVDAVAFGVRGSDPYQLGVL